MRARVDAKPFLDRQLPEAGPLLFWRPGADETRDGMLWVVSACTNPACSCRDAKIEIFNVDDRLPSAEDADGRLEHSHRRIEGRAPLAKRRARISIDVDTGRVEPDHKRENDPELVAWASAQVDGAVLALLQRRFAQAKERGLAEITLDFDEETWQPGNLLAYSLVHANENVEIELDGARYLVDDQHCVRPGCNCDDVMLDFHVIHEATREARFVGSAWLALDAGMPREFESETPTNVPLLRALLERYRRGDESLQGARAPQ